MGKDKSEVRNETGDISIRDFETKYSAKLKELYPELVHLKVVYPENRKTVIPPVEFFIGFPQTDGADAFDKSEKFSDDLRKYSGVHSLRGENVSKLVDHFPHEYEGIESEDFKYTNGILFSCSNDCIVGLNEVHLQQLIQGREKELETQKPVEAAVQGKGNFSKESHQVIENFGERLKNEVDPKIELSYNLFAEPKNVTIHFANERQARSFVRSHMEIDGVSRKGKDVTFKFNDISQIEASIEGRENELSKQLAALAKKSTRAEVFANSVWDNVSNALEKTQELTKEQKQVIESDVKAKAEAAYNEAKGIKDNKNAQLGIFGKLVDWLREKLGSDKSLQAKFMQNLSEKLAEKLGEKAEGQDKSHLDKILEERAAKKAASSSRDI